MRAAYIAGSALCAVLLGGTFGAQAGKLSEDPDAPWIPGLPIANSFSGVLDLDSNPSGAEATTSLGSGCRTPCSLEITAEGPFTVTFTQEGYEPTSVEVKIQHARMGVSERKFAPNPVSAQLVAVAPPPPPAPPKKTIATVRPPHAPGKPARAAQPARGEPARGGFPAESKPIAPAAIAPAETARSTLQPPQAAPTAQPPTAQPPQAAPKEPVARTQPASPAAAPPPARQAPAPPPWPVEAKPIPGGPLVVRSRENSADNPVAKRWLDDPAKPADQQNNSGK